MVSSIAFRGMRLSASTRFTWQKPDASAFRLMLALYEYTQTKGLFEATEYLSRVFYNT